MTTQDKFLGVGCTWPPVLVNGSWALSDGPTSVAQSCADILSTQLGEKFFLREYGSRLEELAFEQNDTVLLSLVKTFIKDSLTLWEKRCTFESATAARTKEDTLEVSVTCRLLNSNEIFSFVYPFYTRLAY